MQTIRLIPVLFLVQFSMAQTPQELKSADAFATLTDSTMQREIATFSSKGAALWGRDSLLSLKMTEIPISSCSGDQVSFSRPKKLGAYIDLYLRPFDPSKHLLTYEAGTDPSLALIDGRPYWGTSGNLPQRKVDSVFFVLHSHYLIDFPVNAFDGIYEPMTCDHQPAGKRPAGDFQSSGFKLFRSKNTHNTYLYVHGGTGNAEYEAVWILQNDRYLRRIVEELE